MRTSAAMEYEFDNARAADTSIIDGIQRALLGMVEIFDEPVPESPSAASHDTQTASRVPRSSFEDDTVNVMRANAPSKTMQTNQQIKGRKGKLIQSRGPQQQAHADDVSYDTPSARTTASPRMGPPANTQSSLLSHPPSPGSGLQPAMSTNQPTSPGQPKGFFDMIVQGVTGLRTIGRTATDVLDKLDASFEMMFHPEHGHEQGTLVSPQQQAPLGVLQMRSGGRPSPLVVASRPAGGAATGASPTARPPGAGTGNKPRLNVKQTSIKIVASGQPSPRCSAGGLQPPEGEATATTSGSTAGGAMGRSPQGSVEAAGLPPGSPAAIPQVPAQSSQARDQQRASRAVHAGGANQQQSQQEAVEAARSLHAGGRSCLGPVAAAAEAHHAGGTAQADRSAVGQGAGTEGPGSESGSAGLPGCPDCVVSRKRLAQAKKKNQELEAQNNRLCSTALLDPVLCCQLECLLADKAKLLLENCRLQREVAGLQQLLAYTWEHQMAQQDYGLQDDETGDEQLHDGSRYAGCSYVDGYVPQGPTGDGSQGGSGWGSGGGGMGSDAIAAVLVSMAGGSGGGAGQARTGADACEGVQGTTTTAAAPADFVRQLATLFAPEGDAAAAAAAAVGVSGPFGSTFNPGAFTPLAPPIFHEEVQHIDRYYSSLLANLPSSSAPLELNELFQEAGLAGTGGPHDTPDATADVSADPHTGPIADHDLPGVVAIVHASCVEPEAVVPTGIGKPGQDPSDGHAEVTVMDRRVCGAASIPLEDADLASHDSAASLTPRLPGSRGVGSCSGCLSDGGGPASESGVPLPGVDVSTSGVSTTSSSWGDSEAGMLEVTTGTA